MVSSWWGDPFLAEIGTPTYAPTNLYTHFALSFWLTTGPTDVALAWAEAGTYFSWISDNTQIAQKTIKKAFTQANKKLMISAFGPIENPTLKDSVLTANKLADFVLLNNLDGVNIDCDYPSYFLSGKA